MRFAFLNNLLFLLAFSFTSAVGQSVIPHEQAGKPFGFQHFLDDLPHQGQNWYVTQDKRGVIYVANHSGVLEYDGHEWRQIPIDGLNTAFSLAVDSSGIVYVGARDDFGYLAPDSSGMLRYRSLRAHVQAEDLDFGVVWTVSATSEAVFFQANTRLFRWDGDKMDVWRSDQRMHTSFAVHDRFFLKRDSVGLLEMIGDSLRLVEGGSYFSDKRVFSMAPKEAGQILIGAQKDMDGPLELFIFSGTELTPLPVDRHLKNDDFAYTFYNGTALPGGYMALGTLYHGVFIIDQEGKLVEALDADRGVFEDVNYTFSDYQGGLWLAHNHSGITYIASPARLSLYGKEEGLIGPANSILRHNDHLYVSTVDGLFSLQDRLLSNEEDDILQFTRAASDLREGVYWSLQAFEDDLLVASELGVFSLDQKDVAEFVGFAFPNAPAVLHKSSFYKDRVYVGLSNGLGMLTRTRTGWSEQKLDGPARKVTTIEEAADGSIWLTTSAPGHVYRLVIDDAGNVVDEQEIASAQQLDAMMLRVKLIEGKPGVIALPKGIYQVTQTTAGEYSLTLDQRFPSNGAGNEEILDIVKVRPSEFWTSYSDRVDVTMLKGGETHTESMSGDLNLPEIKDFRTVYRDENNVVWISAANMQSLIKFDPRLSGNPHLASSQSPLIRRLTVIGTDSLLYGGAFSTQSAARKFKKGKILELDLQHTDNDLRFEFAVPDYNKKDKIEYRYVLEGHDENWSKWTSETEIIYRNIGQGKLNFKLQARLGGLLIDEIASMSLRIRAPWFWTWWMQLFYVLFVGFSAFQFVRNQRTKKQIVLLNIERELNARLQMANEQLRTANGSLEQANRMKDEFLANASHELRTPLTAILGFTSVLKEEVPEENLEFLGLIDENGKRLLQTINSLLDLAKLRAGMFELKFEPLDICKKSEEVVDLLTQLAKNQNLSLDIECPDDLAKVRLDSHCYERILYNLIGNAIKFTTSGGVKVIVERNTTEIQVHVIDTGIGIDESFIPLLFDEFKQEPNNEIRSEGSGLGLTITAKLVELMDGTISVKSKKGKGSTFTVSFMIDEVEIRSNDLEGALHSEEETHSTLQ